MRKKLSEKLIAPEENAEYTPEKTAISRILDLARWTPSSSNTQPWKFKFLDENTFLIHSYDTRDWCVYDLDGRASQTGVGALQETISIAASGEGLTANFSPIEESAENQAVFRVELSEVSENKSDPLLPFIKIRTTQRRSFSTRPLTALQKQQFEQAVGESFRIIWIEGWETKWLVAKLLFRNAQIRLTIEEAYEVHKRIIEWDALFSCDKIPDKAVGLDTVTLKIMRWAMQSWDRVDMLNKYFAGTWLPRIQLDLIPALRCAAHFVIVSYNELYTVDDYLFGGRAMQRFWLTASRLGLQFQPEMTPLIFSRYVNTSKNFTQDNNANLQAEQLSVELDNLLGKETQGHQVFMGRLGQGRYPVSRSTRNDVSDLMLN